MGTGKERELRWEPGREGKREGKRNWEGRETKKGEEREGKGETPQRVRGVGEGT